MACSFEGCGKKVAGNGLCTGHYQQYAKGGMESLRPLRERLKIDRTAKCSVDGCENLVEKKHLCGKHYQRKKKTGDPLGSIPRKGKTDLELKITRRLTTMQEGDCWEWTGFRTDKGYGHITANEVNEQLSHRAAYKLWIGDIPDNLCVLHKCDNPSCCNPDHLFLGDNNDNVQDMIEKGRDRCFNKKRKLSDDDVAVIIDKSNSLKYLSDLFGISTSMISLIRCGKNYKQSLQRLTGVKK